VSGIGPSEIAFFGQEIPATYIWYNGLKIHKETSYKYNTNCTTDIFMDAEARGTK
jgi:hypothetical protein